MGMRRWRELVAFALNKVRVGYNSERDVGSSALERFSIILDHIRMT